MTTSTTSMTTPTTPPLQPLLGDAVIALRAPTQVWSGRDGDLGAAPIDGVYHGDVRHVRGLTLECAESAIEYISLAPDSASHVVFGGLLRGADDATPDPRCASCATAAWPTARSPRPGPSPRTWPSRRA
jgi:hypothetical protein